VIEELDMIAVATPKKVVLFDYESIDPTIVQVFDVPNVTYITWLDCHVILCIEDEDSDDVTLASYELEGTEPIAQITIKQFNSQ